MARKKEILPKVTLKKRFSSVQSLSLVRKIKKKKKEFPFISVRIDLAVLYLWNTIFQRDEMGEQ